MTLSPGLILPMNSVLRVRLPTAGEVSLTLMTLSLISISPRFPPMPPGPPPPGPPPAASTTVETAAAASATTRTADAIFFLLRNFFMLPTPIPGRSRR